MPVMRSIHKILLWMECIHKSYNGIVKSLNPVSFVPSIEKKFVMSSINFLNVIVIVIAGSKKWCNSNSNIIAKY